MLKSDFWPWFFKCSLLQPVLEVFSKIPVATRINAKPWVPSEQTCAALGGESLQVDRLPAFFVEPGSHPTHMSSHLVSPSHKEKQIYPSLRVSPYFRFSFSVLTSLNVLQITPQFQGDVLIDTLNKIKLIHTKHKTWLCEDDCTLQQTYCSYVLLSTFLTVYNKNS